MGYPISHSLALLFLKSLRLTPTSRWCTELQNCTANRKGGQGPYAENTPQKHPRLPSTAPLAAIVPGHRVRARCCTLRASPGEGQMMVRTDAETDF